MLVRIFATLAVVVSTAAACASAAQHDLLATGAGPLRAAYRGPLFVPIPASGDDASVRARSGAAGRALECRYPQYGGGQGVYDDGLTEVASSYVAAAQEFVGPTNDGGILPTSGYRVERTVGNRVLLSFDVHQRTKAALILRSDITDYRDKTGWGVETWAACDPAEYPSATIAHLGFGVWQDGSGRPAPLARVRSLPDHTWCDSADVSYLTTGRDPHETIYVRDADRQYTRFLRVAYDGHASLPSGSVDSGYHRDGRELWFGPGGTAVYLVSLTEANAVQRWPAVKPGVGCD